MRLLCLALPALLFALGCDSPEPAADAGPRLDAGANDAGPVQEDAGPIATDAGPIEVDAGPIEVDAGPIDAGPADDAGHDGGPPQDAGVDGGPAPRQNILTGFCSGSVRGPGLYQGNLRDSTHDFNRCSGSSVGKDGSVFVDVPAGSTLRAVYRHAMDGVIYLHTDCGRLTSCEAESDASGSGPEELTWTNSGGSTVQIALILDSHTPASEFVNQPFELDIFITP